MTGPVYRLELDPRPHHLHARVSGPNDTVEVSIAYWSELAAACEAGGVRRLLVEELLEGQAAPDDMDTVVEGLLQLGFHDIRIAFVDATEDATLLLGAEIRAQRSGLVGRVFRSVAEAERWLLADLAAPAGPRPPAV
ncbi:hypothetical protein [Lysobacter humi (ex Lee et al. 2017)]